MELLRTLMDLQARHGALTDETLREVSRTQGVPLYRLEGLRSFYPFFRDTPGPAKQVAVCRDVACCMAAGEDPVEAVQRAVGGRSDVEVSGVSCLGQCDRAPAAAINEHPVSGSIDAIAHAVDAPESPAHPPRSPQGAQRPVEPYGSKEERFGVFKSLVHGSGDADTVIQTLKDSGLRGMGGAGFPTGMKWDFTRRASGTPRYVVCNADESEPGTFKDRVILEELPHLMVEAMAIGAWVVGADHGIVYIRHEYHDQAHAVEEAIAEARAHGVVGPDAFGPGRPFRLEVFVSPGGYIMGEETALLEGLEDDRGEPRNKPPFPTNEGLWGQPTLMNNVETFAVIPSILRNGAQWWRDQGVRGYAGLKFLSASGDLAQPGVHCVPVGTTIQELIDRCGGMKDGKALLAFSPGGASTRFLPAERADTPIDFDALQEAGSALGSGAAVFVAEGRDMLEIATAQTRFFARESCGKCVPCRVGSKKAVRMLEDALQGQPTEGLEALLHELDDNLAQTSICGLGQVALSPVTGVLEHFPETRQRLGGGANR